MIPRYKKFPVKPNLEFRYVASEIRQKPDDVAFKLLKEGNIISPERKWKEHLQRAQGQLSIIEPMLYIASR